MAITSGLSASDAGLGRLLLVTSISSLVAGLFFAVIYGLTNLVRPRIYVRDTCIVRSRRRASERWNYADLKRYTITEVLIGVDSIRSLTIEMRNGGEATVEIADHIDDLDVRRVLDRRIRSHQR
jgi:hypothetical protein